MYKGLKVLTIMYLENTTYKILNQNNWLAWALIAACMVKNINTTFQFYQLLYLCFYKVPYIVEHAVIPGIQGIDKISDTTFILPI